MEAGMRLLTITATTMTAMLVAMAVPAAAQSVPPVKGNDTGGIISYHSFPPQVIREIAFQHCASYGKITKLTGVQARYGGYVSFACIWKPTVVRGPTISVMY
jgi:hypothetical protein